MSDADKPPKLDIDPLVPEKRVHDHSEVKTRRALSRINTSIALFEAMPLNVWNNLPKDEKRTRQTKEELVVSLKAEKAELEHRLSETGRLPKMLSPIKTPKPPEQAPEPPKPSKEFIDAWAQLTDAQQALEKLQDTSIPASDREKRILALEAEINNLYKIVGIDSKSKVWRPKLEQ